MSRHKDLNKARSLLDGSQGGIIEHHPEAITDPNKKYTRRNRKKYIYQNDEFCTYDRTPCMGVSCGSYSEKRDYK